MNSKDRVRRGTRVFLVPQTAFSPESFGLDKLTSGLAMNVRAIPQVGPPDGGGPFYQQGFETYIDESPREPIRQVR